MENKKLFGEAIMELLLSEGDKTIDIMDVENFTTPTEGKIKMSHILLTSEVKKAFLQLNELYIGNPL